MPDYQLIVNGKKTILSVDDEKTPLLWVLRDNLGLTGTKYSCGEGICGTCTVHIDGKAERSCSILIKDAAGKSITTIEGLASDKDQPIFETWIDLDVSQCGYCQPGQIMTLAALIKEKPTLTKEQIEETMSTVLCRCGTYPRIKKAIDIIVEEGK